MGIVVVVAYVVVVLFIVLVLSRLLSVAFEILRPERRRRPERSGRDRRRRMALVALDRRCGPRRQDDIAVEFLSQSDSRFATVVRESAGRQEA